MHIEYLGTRYCYDVPRIYSIVDTPYKNLSLFEVYLYDPVADKLTGNTDLSSRISSIMKRAMLFTYLPEVMIEQIIKYRIDGHLIFVYKCIAVSVNIDGLKYFYLCDYSFETGAIKSMSKCFRYNSRLTVDTCAEYIKTIKYSFCSKALDLEFPYAI